MPAILWQASKRALCAPVCRVDRQAVLWAASPGRSPVAQGKTERSETATLEASERRRQRGGTDPG